MQTDMHYYGTYALARIAGFDVKSAEIIGYSAQYVDDSTSNDSDEHEDGGLIYGIATAHHNSQVIKNRLADLKEQKQVWVPFHFYPGGEGDTVSEKLLCRKDSPIAREMVSNNIQHAKQKIDTYGLYLIGITAHVYADTFSHYGFSGVSSSNNEVEADSITLIGVKNEEMEAFLTTKFGRFMKKYAPSMVMSNWRKFAGSFAEAASGALGHGAVGTYPDRPFLYWQFKYEKSGDVSDRNNLETFLEGCEKLYDSFVKFGQLVDENHQPNRQFSDVKDKVREILALECVMEDRVTAWRDAISANQLFDNEDEEALDYQAAVWERQKEDFPTLDESAMATELDVYKFHQAATYHRYYTLKDLLPKHDIVIF